MPTSKPECKVKVWYGYYLGDFPGAAQDPETNDTANGDGEYEPAR
jgi:hypothetical protein